MILLLCMAVGVFGVSCSGDDGADGTQGEMGPQGPPGPPGPAGPGVEEATGEDSDCDEFAVRGRLFQGGSGDDVICGDDHNNMIKGGDGDDTVFGKDGDDTIYGEDGDDTIHGEKGNDKIKGQEGRDVLMGGEGNDVLVGGEHDDEFIGGPGSDTVKFLQPDGMGGFVTATTSDGVVFVPYGQSDLTTLDGTPMALEINLANGYADDEFGDTDNYEGIENVEAGGGADILTGDDGDNTFRGYLGDDTINGGAGNDYLDGGAGADTINGGDGDDTIVNGTGDTLDGGKGSDTLLVTGTFDLGTQVAAGEVGARNFENLNASGATSAVTLNGNDGPNILQGSPANDTLLDGKLGKDVYVLLYDGGGMDTIAYEFPAVGVAGTHDLIHIKGAPSDKRKIESVTDANDSDADKKISIGGKPLFQVQDAPTATSILRAPNMIMFVD